MNATCRILWVLACLAAACGAYAETFRAVSPDGRNEIRLEADSGLRYSVWRDGVQRLAPAEVSLSVRGRQFSPQVVSSGAFTLSGVERTRIYKKSTVSLAANGCRIALAGGFGLELVARDDGVAYRFTTSFPEAEVLVDAERAPVSLPSGELSVWAGYPVINVENGRQGWISNWEPVYTNLSAAAAGLKTDRFAALPLVVEYADGACLCVTESDQRDYPGWLLRGSGKPSALDGEFAPEPIEEKCKGPYHHANMTRHDYIARTKGTRTYPWRLFVLAGSPAGLCEGDAPYALAEPCRLEDTSWIRPGLVQWDWWHNRNLTQVDFRAGMNTATYLHYVDFAADSGVPYVLIDGGWSTNYVLLCHKPELDLKAVAARAAQRGVSLIIWTPWAALIGRQEETFAAYRELGIKGVKIDGISRNDRYLTKFVEETARIAARYHVAIDYHGISKPSGLSRTYPNILTYEGVHGLENTKWEGGSMEKCDFPKNDLTVFFCRQPAGPMDYTPGAMINFAKGAYRVSYMEPGSEGTRVRQLAMYVLYESPLQMLSDSPVKYRANRECFDFMRKVPTVWDETRGLAGRIGAFAAVARRSGDVWYAGAMTDWEPRELELSAKFLGSGEWKAEMFEDGINADRDGTDWRRVERTVRAGDSIPVKMAPGGGWAARFSRISR
jgi:alpha-glucosidase